MKIREVPRLRYDRHATVHDIASACTLSTSTVREYLYRSEASQLSWPLTDEISDEDLERRLFPPRLRKGESERPLPDFAKFRIELTRKGMTLLLLWKECRREHPDGYGYSRLADLYKKWEKSSFSPSWPYRASRHGAVRLLYSQKLTLSREQSSRRASETPAAPRSASPG